MCLALGVEHPDYLTLDAEQIQEWWAYSQIEPFGFHQDNLRTGVISAILANQWSAGKAYSPSDFFPNPDVPKRQQSVEEMSSILKGLSGG